MILTLLNLLLYSWRININLRVIKMKPLLGIINFLIHAYMTNYERNPDNYRIKIIKMEFIVK